jgi:RNA polymerase sigma-70 factor (ECF subfamily)
MIREPDAATLARLEAAVARMPRLQREILLAIRLEDLSYAELAKCTGLTSREVERQFAKALEKLCRQMNGGKLRWWERCDWLWRW